MNICTGNIKTSQGSAQQIWGKVADFISVFFAVYLRMQ